MGVAGALAALGVCSGHRHPTMTARKFHAAGDTDARTRRVPPQGSGEIATGTTTLRRISLKISQLYILTVGPGAIRVVPEIPSVAGTVVPVLYTTNTSRNHATVRTSGSDINPSSFSTPLLLVKTNL